ncbi:MAG: ABC transporter ATP-binding protein [Chloroflexota bacterium]
MVKSYALGDARVQALRGVDVTVARGEIVAIMGPSGCGKTTLLQCLSGLDDPDGGEIWIGGQPLAGMSDNERSRLRAQHTGFIFQSYNLLGVLTALENVEMPLLLAGIRGRQARQRATAALARVGLGDRTHHRPLELSGGQQQRVAIARALVNEPAVVWADEPTGNLDSSSAEAILSLLDALNRERSLSLVIVTHDPAVAERSHRVLHMADGLIVREHVPAARHHEANGAALTAPSRS